MNVNIFGNVINIIFSVVGVVIVIGISVRILKDKYAKEKTVDAIIINKQTYSQNVMSKHRTPYTTQKYIVTFQCDNKKLNLYVSEFSYDIYKINQKGKLTYKGSKIIDFT